MSGSISPALLAKRTEAKASKLYNNSSWDLVDAMESGAVELESLAPDQIPTELQTMDKEKQKAYIQSKSAERRKIQSEIAALSKQRHRYVAEKQRAAAGTAGNTISDALIDAIHKQAKNKAYVFAAQD